MSVMTENTLAGSGGPRRCCSSAPDGLDYEPVIRSGHYWVGTVRMHFAFWPFCLNEPLPHSCPKPDQGLLQA
nr:MAG TPA: hypothetical protein [Caudoviricetes sp.]